MAERIQRSRKRGWRMPENTVAASRTGPNVRPFLGNPFAAHVQGKSPERQIRERQRAVDLFRSWLLGESHAYLAVEQRKRIIEALPYLRGKNLACWCPLDQPCHADVLLELAKAGKHKALGNAVPFRNGAHRRPRGTRSASTGRPNENCKGR